MKGGVSERHYLPREEDRIMSGYFGFVAICVTQPLWPRSVPLSCKVSVISICSRTRYIPDGIGFFRVNRVQWNIERKRANSVSLSSANVGQCSRIYWYATYLWKYDKAFLSPLRWVFICPMLNLSATRNITWLKIVSLLESLLLSSYHATYWKSKIEIGLKQKKLKFPSFGWSNFNF